SASIRSIRARLKGAHALILAIPHTFQLHSCIFGPRGQQLSRRFRRSGPFAGGGADAFSGAIWIVLKRGCFATESSRPGSWIRLDFLGFSRPNRDFSMGYADPCGKEFSRGAGVPMTP